MKIDFTNKNILITGGTRGIGASLVTEFSQLGASVYATGTQKDAIDECNKNKSSDSIHYLQLDFCDSSSVQNFQQSIEKLNQMDVLINNAGVNKIAPIDEVQEEDWDWVNQVNLKGAYLMSKLVSQKMKKHGCGKIINIASIFGVVSKAKRSVYSTTKWGLIGLTKGMALDLAPYNVLVNAISPGFVDTELTRNILSKEERMKLASEVPLGRFAQVEEIAKTVLFLASDENTYITGQNLIIDGGFVSQ